MCVYVSEMTLDIMHPAGLGQGFPAVTLPTHGYDAETHVWETVFSLLLSWLSVIWSH